MSFSCHLQQIYPPFLPLFDSLVVYECCPGYMKLEGMRGCPAGTRGHPIINC